MCCFYPCLHRHQIHLISYGCVSFTLLATGLVFTIFSVFQKDSQIGKVWLAGPTTMVVGLVLCGKVIIDWGPAMTHGRGDTDSVDSRLIDQLTLSNPLVSVAGLPNGETTYLKTPLSYGGIGSGGEAGLRKFSDRKSLSQFDYLDQSLRLPRNSFPQRGPTTLINAPECGHHSFASSVPQLNVLKSSSIDRLVPTETRDSDSSGNCDDVVGERGAVDFITYDAHSNSNISFLNSAQTTQNVLEKPPPATVGTQTIMSLLLPRAFHAPLAVEDDSGSPALALGAQLDHPQCSCHLGGVVVEEPQWRRTENYGSVAAFENTRAVEEHLSSYDSLQLGEERRAARVELYQGETFVMNDKTFLI